MTRTRTILEARLLESVVATKFRKRQETLRQVQRPEASNRSGRQHRDARINMNFSSHNSCRRSCCGRRIIDSTLFLDSKGRSYEIAAMREKAKTSPTSIIPGRGASRLPQPTGAELLLDDLGSYKMHEFIIQLT